MDFMQGNGNVILAIVGLLLAAISTIIEKLAPQHRKVIRSILIAIVIVGFVITACATWLQELKNRKTEAQIGLLLDPNKGVLTDVDLQLKRIEADLSSILPTHTVHGPAPAAPVALPPKDEYFVQIEASASEDLLHADIQRIQKTYNLPNDFMAIINIPGPSQYKLAFGQHLDKATAQKYAEVANNLGLAPRSQSAYVRQQPK